MKIKPAVIALLVAFALLLSACTVNMHTKINSDGSGDWITEIGFTTEDEASLTQMGFTSVEDYCTQSATDMPAEASTSIEVRGEETYCVYTVPFATLEALRAAYTETDGVVVNRLEIVDGVLYYDLTVDGGSGDMGSMGISTNWILTMPGSIQSHNAPTQDGNQLTWVLSTTGATAIQAQSKVSGMSSDITMYVTIALSCLCCLVVIVIIAVVVFLVLRKRKQTPAAPANLPPAL